MNEKELYREYEIAKSKLNYKQQAFADAYINNHGNATQAYKSAGYKCTTEQAYGAAASKLLKTDKVQKYISISKQINASYCSVERQDIIRKLEHMITSGEFPANQVLTAIQMLNQMNGWNAPTVTKTKSEVTFNDESIKRMNEISGMSYEEKVEKLKQLKEHVQFNN